MEIISYIRSSASNALLFIKSWFKEDVSRCPKCGKANQARVYVCNTEGWTFKATCSKCGHKYEWRDS